MKKYISKKDWAAAPTLYSYEQTMTSPNSCFVEHKVEVYNT